MPTDIRIIHAGDFIKATPEGKLDFEKTKKILVKIASSASHLADYEIILDTRKAQSELSITDLYSLAAELCRLREAFCKKMAVVCPLKRFAYGEFLELCARNRGFQVAAFTSLGDAVEWLIETKP
jgi:hypothetical protein